MDTNLILQILYITLIVFTIIVGSLLSIVLVKVIRILGPIIEILDTYTRIKGIFSVYTSAYARFFRNIFKSFIRKK